MLKHLYIKNYALIDELDINFESGFSVITGETGAGKSIILGAIGLLLGQRADSKVVKADAGKCTIEAHFDISQYNMKAWFDSHDLDGDDVCILRRELTASGKSRAFINDTPTSLLLMRELGEKLVDVHSQHQNLLLQKEDFQLSVLDVMASNKQQFLSYTDAYKEYRKAEDELQLLRQQIASAHENEEFMRYQLQELNNAALTAGEQETLEKEQETASHAEEIKTLLYDAGEMLRGDDDGALALLRQSCQKLSAAARLYDDAKPLAERMDSTYIELKDIAHEIETHTEHIDFNPERMAEIDERLDTIYTLQRKFHKNTIEELLDEQATLQQAIDNIDNSEDALAKKEGEVGQLRKAAEAAADALTTTRLHAVGKVERAISDTLTSLGMPNVDFKIDISAVSLHDKGQDRVAFLFSANKGMPLRPVAQVASGGEIARVMLSLKAMISYAVKLPTIIFDEIDTGVSGRVAERMADIMRQMGDANRQVISITHLPQIAAKGTHHYKVEKRESDKQTTSVMRQLSDDERINEIAQMLSGAQITEAARTNARALLKM